MNFDDKILVTGHKGLVGGALRTELSNRGYSNVIVWDRKEVDLRDPVQVKWAFSVYRPKYVFMAGAKVGGIKANKADQIGFMVDNWNMQQNVMLNAAEFGCKKLLFLGSSCIYPEHAENPIPESDLLSGPLQKANEGYALAKICGVKLAQYLKRERGFNCISAMPCNLFGPGDNFNMDSAHVVPGMMARMHWAKVYKHETFAVWGSPDAKRELLYSFDLADALIHLMNYYNEDTHINVGSDTELSMLDLARAVAEVVHYKGEIVFTGTDTGTFRKKMWNQKLKSIGYISPNTSFKVALEQTYSSFLNRLVDPMTPKHRI